MIHHGTNDNARASWLILQSKGDFLLFSISFFLLHSPPANMDVAWCCFFLVNVEISIGMISLKETQGLHLASMHLKLHYSIARFGFSKSKLQTSAKHWLMENPALLQIQMSPNIKNPTSTTTICSGNHSPKRALVTSPLKKRLGFASMILTAISTTKNTSMHGNKSPEREMLMSLEAQHPNSTI